MFWRFEVKIFRYIREEKRKEKRREKGREWY
jgi:hypothetical protein